MVLRILTSPNKKCEDAGLFSCITMRSPYNDANRASSASTQPDREEAEAGRGVSTHCKSDGNQRHLGLLALHVLEEHILVIFQLSLLAQGTKTNLTWTCCRFESHGTLISSSYGLMMLSHSSFVRFVRTRHQTISVQGLQYPASPWCQVMRVLPSRVQAFMA